VRERPADRAPTQRSYLPSWLRSAARRATRLETSVTICGDGGFATRIACGDALLNHLSAGNQSSDGAPARSLSLMICMTEVSASVVVSPIARPSATSRSRRRMILPERVFGSSVTM